MCPVQVYTTVTAALQTASPAYRVYFLRQTERIDDYCAIVAVKEFNRNAKDIPVK